MFSIMGVTLDDSHSHVIVGLRDFMQVITRFLNGMHVSLPVINWGFSNTVSNGGLIEPMSGVPQCSIHLDF